MAGKARVVQMVRSVGVLIVCHRVACGDPRSGAVVNQVADKRYVAAAMAGHKATHEGGQ
jgi:hypothetical protein